MKTKYGDAERSQLYGVFLGKVPAIYSASHNFNLYLLVSVRLLSVQIVVPQIDASENLLDAATSLVLHQYGDQMLGTQSPVALAIQGIDLVLADHVLLAIIVSLADWSIGQGNLRISILGRVDHLGIILEETSIGQVVQVEALQQIGNGGHEGAAP